MLHKLTIAGVVLALLAICPLLNGAELTPEQRAKVLLLLEQEASTPKPAPAIAPKVTTPAVIAPTTPQGAIALHSNLASVPLPAKPVAKAAVPTPRSRWSHPGSTKSALINHLLADPHHAGHFTRSQLEQYSYAELERWHSADHEGTRRPASSTSVKRLIAAAESGCPGGHCPNTSVRRGLLGGRR